MSLMASITISATTAMVPTKASTTRNRRSAPANSVAGMARNSGCRRCTSVIMRAVSARSPVRSRASVKWPSLPAGVNRPCAWRLPIITPPSNMRLPVRKMPLTRWSLSPNRSSAPGCRPSRCAPSSPSIASSRSTTMGRPATRAMRLAKPGSTPITSAYELQDSFSVPMTIGASASPCSSTSVCICASVMRDEDGARRSCTTTS